MIAVGQPAAVVKSSPTTRRRDTLQSSRILTTRFAISSRKASETLCENLTPANPSEELYQ